MENLCSATFHSDSSILQAVGRRILQAEQTLVAQNSTSLHHKIEERWQEKQQQQKTKTKTNFQGDRSMMKRKSFEFDS